MVKINTSAGTNINHIRQSLSTNKISEMEESEIKSDFLGHNHSTSLAASLHEHQYQIGFFQALEQSFQKLDGALKELEETESKEDFGFKVEKMMDVVDSSLYGGKALFGVAVSFGFELPSLEEIESYDSVIAFEETIATLRQDLDEKLKIASVAAINTLSALSAQAPRSLEKESHVSQLERIQALLKDA